ncbi:MAG: hypothetical protein NVS3B19_10120 [Ginsengibacter sp.]
MIPSKALMIVHLNGRSLNAKMPWDEVKKTAWFTKIYNDSSTTSWLKKVLDNPETSGIDQKGDIVFFLSHNLGTEQNFVLEGDIKDVKNFETFNKNFAEAGNVTKDGANSFLTLKNNGVVGWNGKRFAYVFEKDLPRLDSGLMIHTGYSENAPPVQTCRNLFSLKEDSSMRNNNNFTTLLNETGDVHVWQNNEEIFKSTPAMAMTGMLKMDVFIHNNVSTYSVNFEDGKIDVRQKWYASSELMNVLKKYSGGTVNNQMIKSIPTQNIIGLISMHFKPQGIAELVKLTGMDGFVNLFLAQQGFNLDDFVAANKGDIQISVSDLVISKDSTGDSTSSFKHSAKVLFASSIGDKPSFNKILNAGSKMATKMKKDSGISYKNNDQYFVAGNDAAFVNAFYKGANNSFTFLDKIKDHPIAIYVDLNKLLSTLAGLHDKDTTAATFINDAAKRWDKLISTGGEIEGDAYTMHTEILMTDKSTNSLKQMNSLLDLAVKLHHDHNWNLNNGKHKSDGKKGMEMDSSTVK